MVPWTMICYLGSRLFILSPPYLGSLIRYITIPSDIYASTTVVTSRNPSIRTDWIPLLITLTTIGASSFSFSKTVLSNGLDSYSWLALLDSSHGLIPSLLSLATSATSYAICITICCNLSMPFYHVLSSSSLSYISLRFFCPSNSIFEAFI